MTKPVVSVGEPTVKELLSPYDRVFLIPEYQRPYRWDEDNCSALFDDLFANLADDSMQCLGTIVTFQNEKAQEEIVDAQQRIVTILLLMRVLYEFLDNSSEIKKQLSFCLYLANKKYVVDTNTMKVIPAAVFDFANDQLKNIIKLGYPAKGDKSVYAKNFKFFKKEISNIADDYPEALSDLGSHLLEKVYFIHLRAISRDAAETYCETINDRGQGFRVEDSFKILTYQYTVTDHSLKGKGVFAKKWEALRLSCKEALPTTNSKAEPLTATEFAYLLYVTKCENTVDPRTLKSFYKNNGWLKDPQTLNNISAMVFFFHSLSPTNTDLPGVIRRKMFILINFNARAVWFLLAAYYLRNNDTSPEKLITFLDRLVIFIVAWAITKPVSDLNRARTNIADKLLEIIAEDVEDRIKFSKSTIEYNLTHLDALSSVEKRCRTFLIWWTYHFENQQIDFANAKNPLNEIEHILARALANNKELRNPKCVEYLGNLALLEKPINAKAEDLPFNGKAKVYRGANKMKKSTANAELLSLTDTYPDWDEPEILTRDKKMVDTLINKLAEHGMISC